MLDPFGINTLRNKFMGMNVYEVPSRMVPKIEIPSDFEWVTDEFRGQHNAWLLDRF